MTRKEFCKLYTEYHGEKVDNVAQIVIHNTDGVELYDFCKFLVREQMGKLIEDGKK